MSRVLDVKKKGPPKRGSEGGLLGHQKPIFSQGKEPSFASFLAHLPINRMNSNTPWLFKFCSDQNHSIASIKISYCNNFSPSVGPIQLFIDPVDCDSFRRAQTSHEQLGVTAVIDRCALNFAQVGISPVNKPGIKVKINSYCCYLVWDDCLVDK